MAPKQQKTLQDWIDYYQHPSNYYQSFNDYARLHRQLIRFGISTLQLVQKRAIEEVWKQRSNRAA